MHCRTPLQATERWTILSVPVFVMNLLWNLSPGVLALPFLRLSYYFLRFVPLVLSDLICSTSNPEQCGKPSVLTYIGGYKRLKDG